MSQPDKIMKPCPFCGGKAELKREDHNDFFLLEYVVECLGCGAQTVGITVVTQNLWKEWSEEQIYKHQKDIEDAMEKVAQKWNQRQN